MKKFFQFLFLASLFALVVPPLTLADSASSSNFNLQGGVNGGGGLSTSTSFSSEGSFGATGQGLATSTSFSVQGGFLYATPVSVIATPNAPSNFVAAPLASAQVSLSWTSNSGGGEDGFSIERKTGVGGTYAVIATVGSGVTSYTDTSAAANTTYFYRVSAFIGTSFSSYSNEGSVTTTSAGGGNSGGGGGGGGISAPVVNTEIVISGSAYPLSTVTVLKDGMIALKTIAGPDGNFSASITGLTAGNDIFSVYGTDSEGRRSTTFNFPITITVGATTHVSGVFLSPTIGLDKTAVKKGDTLTIFGEAAPSAPITIQVDSAGPIFVNTTSSASGAYLYELNTAQLELGSHLAKSEAAAGNLVSDYSKSVAFTVGTKSIAAPQKSLCPPNYPKADLNQDCHVNLVDFSIMAYWWHRSNTPAIYRIDGTSAIDLKDFSILAYEWTG